MSPEHLEKIRLHALWLKCEASGIRADLSDADLRGADLSDADLRDADLRGADLSDADLSGADLRGADLRGADLSDADLHWAYLSGADLRGAYLSGADLSGADLSGSIIYASCSWSDHGEMGRRLMAHSIKPFETTVYSCGCFSGSISDLKEYINEGKPDLKKSRMLAADFVEARMQEMILERKGECE